MQEPVSRRRSSAADRWRLRLAPHPLAEQPVRNGRSVWRYGRGGTIE